MGFLDFLDKAGESSESTLIKFFQDYKRSQTKNIHCFFEGLDDQSFYVNFIRGFYPGDCIFYNYVCDGKANVLNLYQDINWKIYNKNQVLFFIDKDLDDILNIAQFKSRNIFITKFYSIENYLVNEIVFARFIREVCFVTDELVISNLTIQFNDQLERFSRFMDRISAWIIYCRKNNLEVNLSTIDLSKIFQVNSDLILHRLHTKNYTHFQYLCNATKTAHFDLRQIKIIAKNLCRIETRKIYLRGKYELWFFYQFCHKVTTVIVPKLNTRIKNHNKVSPIKLTKCKVTIPVTEDNIIQIAAPRVDIPSELRFFFSENARQLFDD